MEELCGIKKKRKDFWCVNRFLNFKKFGVCECTSRFVF